MAVSFSAGDNSEVSDADFFIDVCFAEVFRSVPSPCRPHSRIRCGSSAGSTAFWCVSGFPLGGWGEMTLLRLGDDCALACSIAAWSGGAIIIIRAAAEQAVVDVICCRQTFGDWLLQTAIPVCSASVTPVAGNAVEHFGKMSNCLDKHQWSNPRSALTNLALKYRQFRYIETNRNQRSAVFSVNHQPRRLHGFHQVAYLAKTVWSLLTTVMPTKSVQWYSSSSVGAKMLRRVFRWCNRAMRM